jgi:membrane-associated phospholipid phosphatase
MSDRRAPATSTFPAPRARPELLERFVRALPAWYEELAHALGPDVLLLAGFLTLLAAVSLACGGDASHLRSSVLLPLGALAALAAVSGLGRSLPAAVVPFARPAWTFVREWFPLLLVLCVYTTFHEVARLVRADTVDAGLRHADELLFGVEPTLLVAPLTTPWLTEYMTFAYALFFVFPTLLLLRVYGSGDVARFREVRQALNLCFYLGLVGYMALPAIGPRYTIAYDVPLTGYWLTRTAEHAWRTIESVQTDCFPSLHTAVSVICLVYFYRLRDLPGGRVLLWVCAPLVVSLVASTIYLRYHYGVDVLAGLAVAAVCTSAAPAIVRAYYRE